MALLALLGLAIVVAINTALTVVLVRFFRLQLDTDWATVIYTLLFVPMALAAATLVLSGALGLGGGVAAGRDVTLALTVVLPMATGIAVDLFWMPAPEEVELPESA